jgi:rhomboid protease GluP
MNVHTLERNPSDNENSNRIVNVYQPTKNNEIPNTSNSSSSSIRCIDSSIYKLKSFCTIILIINAIIYIFELLYHYSFTKKTWICTLYNFGAKDTYSIVHHNQIYRFITPVFLHASIIHIIMNSLSIIFIGYFLERKIGIVKIIILYFTSGIISTIFSATISKKSLGVGASGAIMGFSGLLIVDFLLIYSKMNESQKSNFILFAIMTAINLGGTNIGRDGNKIDNFVHLFGFITGACLSVFLLKNTVDVQQIKKSLLTILQIIFGICLASGTIFCLIYLFSLAKIPINNLRDIC